MAWQSIARQFFCVMFSPGNAARNAKFSSVFLPLLVLFIGALAQTDGHSLQSLIAGLLALVSFLENDSRLSGVRRRIAPSDCMSRAVWRSLTLEPMVTASYHPSDHFWYSRDPFEIDQSWL